MGECMARRRRSICERGHRDEVLEDLLGHAWGSDFILEGMRPLKGFPERGVTLMSQLPLPWAEHCSSLTLHSHYVQEGIITMSHHTYKTRSLKAIVCLSSHGQEAQEAGLESRSSRH